MLSVRIWDLPTRLFHWLLVAFVTGLVITGHVGGNAMVWHFRLGQAVLVLLLFRVVWGFVGGHWSRWRRLPAGPAKVLSYLRTPSSGHTWPGHNPLGSWSLLFMLSWLMLQVGTGLISDDEIAYAGPLTSLVSGTLVSAATAWHKGTGKIGLLALVLLHVLAIVWYRVRKSQALIPAMVHGDKLLPASTPASRDGSGSRILALAVLGICIGMVRWIVSVGGG